MKRILLQLTLFVLYTYQLSSQVITSFSPLSASPNTTVTITGTSLPSIANCKVYFGEIEGKVLTASSTSIVVKVPMGAEYGPLSIVNTSTNTTATANKFFVPTYYTNTLAAANWNTTTGIVSLSTGTATAPNIVFTADFDNDGKLDIITNRTGASLAIFRNTSSGTTNSFAALHSVATTIAKAQNISLFDYNSDGKIDIIESRSGLDTTYVYTNNSTQGSLSFTISYKLLKVGTNHTVRGNAVVDINNNGKPDLITIEEANGGGSSSTMRVYNNNGSTGFTTSSAQAISTAKSWNVAWGDANSDNKIDLATYATGVPTPMHLLPNSNSTAGTTSFGSFVSTTNGDAGQQAGRIRQVDFDNDGKIDVITQGATTNATPFSVLHLYRNISSASTITYATPVQLAITVPSQSFFELGDVNGDGKVDILIASTTNGVNILPNTSTSGSISFGTDVNVPITSNSDVAFADMNGDGRPDIVAANTSGNDVKVYYNKVTYPTPTITSFTPTTGSAQNVITITGTNFHEVSSVKVGGVEVDSFVVNSATSVTARVSTGATGNVSLVTPGGTATSSGTFTFYSPATITSFTPTQGVTGTTVTITGTNFTGASQVKFGTISASSFTVTSPTTIQATVAAGETGNVEVTTPAGSVTSSGTYTYYPLLTFAPTSATYDQKLVINGSGFTSASIVKINNVTQPNIEVVSATKIIVTLNEVAASGIIEVNTSGAISQSATSFTLTAKPLILDFNPKHGPIGTPVTITGLNFASITDEVFFGNVRAIITSNNGTTIVANVPAGSTGGRITVSTAASSLISTSKERFDVTYTGGSIGAFSFHAKTDYFGGTNAIKDFALGDLDNDGKPDITLNSTAVVSGTLASQIFGHENSSTSTSISFLNAGANQSRSMAFNNGIVDMDLMDGDGDGKLDFIQSIDGYNSMISNANTSNTAIGIGINSQSGMSNTGSRGLDKMDFNNDGKIDVVIANNAAGKITIMNNRGSGVTFEEGLVISGITDIKDLAAVDFDKDGRGDIIVFRSNGTTHRLTIFKNTTGDNGDNNVYSFGSPIDVVLTGITNPGKSMAVGDLDSDGYADVVITQPVYPSGYAIYKNTTSGSSISLSSPTIISYTSQDIAPQEVQLADIDGDRKLDIIGAGLYGIELVKNNSTTGTINYSSRYLLITDVYVKVGITDFNQDGKPDIAALRHVLSGSGSSVIVTNSIVDVWRSNQVAPTPIITSIDRNSGRTGTVVTITGTGLNNLTGATINNEPVDVLSVNATTAYITINDTIRTGNIAVTNGINTATGPKFTFIDEAAAPTLVRIQACHNAPFNLYQTGSGGTLQWQKRDPVPIGATLGPWVNLSNSVPYGGVTTASLSISSLTDAMSGTRYRLLVNGVPETVQYLLRYLNYTLGSGDISSASIWSCGQSPTPRTDVILNTDHVLNINSSSTIRQLLTYTGSQLNIISPYQLTITP
jgi:hypothetical protein